MRKRHERAGQTMTEYIVLIALCAIGLLVVVTVFGNDIRQIFFTSSASLRDGAADDIDYAEATDEKHTLGKLSGSEGSSGAGGSSSGGSGGSSGGEEKPENPYKWNAAAKRWYDPDTNLFVSFAAAGKFVDDPYMYMK